MSAARAASFAEPKQPPLAVIDNDHLGRMTMGDARLEREVLDIFARQIELLLARIPGAEPPVAAAAAHTLKGSARGIGAWRVAVAAERVEEAAASQGKAIVLAAATAELETAGREACAVIEARHNEPTAGRSGTVPRGH